MNFALRSLGLIFANILFCFCITQTALCMEEDNVEEDITSAMQSPSTSICQKVLSSCLKMVGNIAAAGLPKVGEQIYPARLNIIKEGLMRHTDLIQAKELGLCYGSACGNFFKELCYDLASEPNSQKSRYIALTKAGISSYAAYRGCKLGIEWSAYALSYIFICLPQYEDFYSYLFEDWLASRKIVTIPLTEVINYVGLSAVPTSSQFAGIFCGMAASTMTSKAVGFACSFF